MPTLYGNTNGLSPHAQRTLERIYRRKIPLSTIATPELMRSLADASHETGRQVGALVHRSGEVDYVVVGDATGLMLPDIGRLRAAQGRFRALRLVHTHLFGEPLSKDDLVDLVRLRLDLVAAVQLSPEGDPRAVHYGYNVPVWDDAVEVEGGASRPVHPRSSAPSVPYRTVGPLPVAHVDVDFGALIRSLEDEFARQRRTRPVSAKDGRAILVHVGEKKEYKNGSLALRSGGKQASSRGKMKLVSDATGGRSHADISAEALAPANGVGVRVAAEESIRELSELARTAGVEVVDTIVQIRDRVDPRTVLGKGKLDDVLLRAVELDAQTLIFDRNLTPTQSATISRRLDLKIIDRTQLILDIFAQRAESADGKLQVELAQLKYALPRLSIKDDSLSRLTGGIGGRGPGETKLEIGRRRAKERVTRLEEQLKKLSRQRVQRRRRRDRQEVPVVSIVGYTNAGKSTLLNALTEADVLAEDKLFATLDTRSRRIRFPEEREVVITDTVGFIRELPRDLFAAFRATFEEVADADLILHVVDASDPSCDQHMQTTEALLEELELSSIPRLLVYNKIDRLSPGAVVRLLRQRGSHDVVALSAMARETTHELLAMIADRLSDRWAQASTVPSYPIGDDAPLI